MKTYATKKGPGRNKKESPRNPVDLLELAIRQRQAKTKEVVEQENDYRFKIEEDKGFYESNEHGNRFEISKSRVIVASFGIKRINTVLCLFNDFDIVSPGEIANTEIYELGIKESVKLGYKKALICVDSVNRANITNMEEMGWTKFGECPGKKVKNLSLFIIDVKSIKDREKEKISQLENENQSLKRQLEELKKQTIPPQKNPDRFSLLETE